MSEQQFDISSVDAVDQLEDCAQVNRLLQQDWVLLRTSENQWRDDEGALRSTVIFTVGHVQR